MKLIHTICLSLALIFQQHRFRTDSKRIFPAHRNQRAESLFYLYHV